MTMAAPPAKFLLSLYHTPSEACGEVFYSVVRAGHLVAGPAHRITRDSYPGHELIYCLKGRGIARLSGRTFNIGPGQLIWVNCHHPHAYWADPANPWELYWLRFDGPHADRICKMLSPDGVPVFAGLNRALVEKVFRRVFQLMQSSQPDAPVWLHAETARLLALLFESRQSSDEASKLEPDLPARLRKPVESMRLYYHRSWPVSQLAALAGMSPSHFFRTFKQWMGTSPHEWLRRQRITQAKRRLIETDDPIKQVALQTGYSDQFFFSKDFKQVTGYTPSEYRRRERGAV